MTSPSFVSDLEIHDNHQATEKMFYQKMGNTDMVVSSIAYGAASLGGVYGEMDPVEGEEQHSLAYAVQEGINFIDTAPWYGQGKSESALGKILPTIPRDSYYIATKVGRYNLDYKSMFNFTADHIVREFDKSLERLGMDSVDLLQIHDVEFSPDMDLILNETLPALEKLRQAGKTRYIGITGYPVSTLKEVVERSPVHIDTVLSYCRCCLHDSSLLQYTPYFKEKGVGVINGSALSMGLLTERGPMQWHSAATDIRAACHSATQYCQSEGVNITRLALKFSLSQDVTTTLISCMSLNQMKQNLETYRTPLTAHEQTVLDHILTTYMKPLVKPHWEGIEIEKFWKKYRASATLSLNT